MVYAISWDFQKDFQEHPDRWINHGRDILRNSCKHKHGVDHKDWCDKCDISEDSAEPMMNFLYPLELINFEDKKILKVVKETNCSVFENQDSGEWFLVLCGGGMDLSQDIGFAYQILETWIPQDLVRNIMTSPFSVSGKNYKKLARGIMKQLKFDIIQNRQRTKNWKESLKNLRDKEKAKELEKQN